MEKQTFKISINAAPEKVWDILWNDITYPEWTSVFSPGSRAESDWKQGSKVLFLNSENDGMVALIAENKPNEFMSFKHIGMIEKGVEDTESEKVRQWAGALENYTLRKVNGTTELSVDMDMTEEYKDYFLQTWPKALDKLKELSEKNS
jgi:hypothetical protein